MEHEDDEVQLLAIVSGIKKPVQHPPMPRPDVFVELIKTTHSSHIQYSMDAQSDIDARRDIDAQHDIDAYYDYLNDYIIDEYNVHSKRVKNNNLLWMARAIFKRIFIVLLLSLLIFFVVRIIHQNKPTTEQENDQFMQVVEDEHA